MGFRSLLAGVFFSAAFCAVAPAWADAPAAAANADLYQKAMQSLSEGRYAEASRILQELVREEPEHAGAWLDIAILQCSIGNAAEADALFHAIETRFAPPPAILEVIALQRAKGCQQPSPKSYARFRLGLGVDDNVNQGAGNPNFSIGSGNNLINLVLSPENTPKADRFTALSAELVQALSPSGTLGFAQFQARQYDALSRFDLNSLLLGIDHPWRMGSWGLRGSASLGLITLGGALYQRQGQLQLQATLPLALPTGWEFGVIGGWTDVAYPSLTGFNSQVWDARGLLTYRNADLFAQASTGYALDHGSEERPGGNRSGVVASLTSRMRLSGEVVGELSWYRQNWKGQRAYSPGLIDQHRQQDTRLLRAAVIFPLTAQHAVHLEYRDVHNRENISLFEYKDRVLQLSWQWQTGY